MKKNNPTKKTTTFGCGFFMLSEKDQRLIKSSSCVNLNLGADTR
jgi:hypothetical protein